MILPTVAIALLIFNLLRARANAVLDFGCAGSFSGVSGGLFLFPSNSELMTIRISISKF